MKTIISILILLLLGACQTVHPPEQSALGKEEEILKKQEQHIELLQENMRAMAIRIRALEEKQLGLTQSIRALANGAQQTAVNEHEDLFNQAALKYAQGDYNYVIQLLNKDLASGVRGVKREHALWLLAQSHQQLAHQESAMMVVRQLMNAFPKSRYIPEAMLLLAQLRIQMQQKDIARDTLREIIHKYPQHKVATQARNLLK